MIVHGNKRAGTGVMGGLGGPGGMRMESMGNLFGYEEWGITSGEEGLGEVGSVSAEVIRAAADSSPPDSQREGMEHLMDEGW